MKIGLFASLAGGIPECGAQVVNRHAVITGSLLQGMEGLGRTSHAQQPVFDKHSGRGGVELQQLLDGSFRINFYHDGMITSFMIGVFALAQRYEKQVRGFIEIKKIVRDVQKTAPGNAGRRR